MNNSFEFNQQPRIKPKKFEAVLPMWQQLLTDLDIELSDDGSDINKLAVVQSYEADIATLLDEMYRKVLVIPSAEEQRAYILSHEPLRLSILRARQLMTDRHASTDD